MLLNSKIKIFTLLIALVMTLGACATDEYGNKRPMTDAEKGAIIGATIGVLAGLTTKEKKKKAVLYGVVGGLSGAAVGHYMDQQKKDFEKQLQTEINAGLITIEKLPQDALLITMTTQTAFDIDSSMIKSGFNTTLVRIAKIVNKYGKTSIIIVGHTDSTGSQAYNQQLSEKRSASVGQFLLGQGVIPQRVSTYGMGEDKPRASNATQEGRTLNRRVEIFIEPVLEQN
jgi:outer membrane protein OmpA-like peptidoglycan-associated protein